ncbi:MAG: Polynucleotide adenylyltransferase/metal dependent phosphohydrolase [Candidatus Uhrbacteria bacterium GW2011_GWE2_40_58]|nr:MAG: Polynucleotide adenylyltransferase/metal dependent phosphohydrolase [Candidatus Uhrbacteria bacterium GW2011_GWF2_40_263]KKR67638.1 MAG: Polynucleotide adenylyltransferase/metal dependent phosphohydrolase [Candidatus Uhrbacteria bacterium GW2011_GWE2_40_58]OGL94434.1 MAG: hypothetical protein A2239_01990 [Candidatus Uhrbacteria bacterium RIFOXYA2_FULL_40_9]OGL96680.1 MAG: hypothetical protein A2332_05160 [Candidatus Uhrbacteria bacterium RIFOXYB2_FULL_41_18]HBK34705.1 hypothetical prote
MQHDTPPRYENLLETFLEKIKDVLEHEPTLAFCQDFLRDYPQAELFLVGGSVRDFFLQRKNKDFDFIIRGVEATSIEKWFKERGDINLVGSHFGVFKFSPNGFPANQFEAIDLALPRTEHATEGSLGGYKDFEMQSDPSLPVETDLSRRDFTINAMAFDIRSSKLLDPFHGQKDLQQKMIRAVGVPLERFSEDMTRMLRAIRQATQLGFEIEPETFQAIQTKMADINLMKGENKEKGGQEKKYVAAREVIAKEMAKALIHDPQKASELFYASGAFRELFPEIHDLRTAQPEYFSPLGQLKNKNSETILALLLREVDPNLAAKRLRSHQFENAPPGSPLRAETRQVLAIQKFLFDKTSPQTTLSLPPHLFYRTFMATYGANFINALHALGQHVIANQLDQRQQDFCKNCGVENVSQMRSLVTGKEVMEALHLSPGPKVGALLQQAFDLQLTGQGKTKEEILKKLS